MMLLRLSLRQFQRGLRSGELQIMSLALVLALTAISAVGFFTDRVHTAVQEQAGESLAADLVLSSGEPLTARFMQIAVKAGARTSQVVDFPTVLYNGNTTVLTDIHAVSPGYPLRGQVRISAQPFGPAHVVRDIPASGTVWVEARVLTTLGLKVGDSLQVGKLKARIAYVIAYLPDGGFGFSSLAPKVLLNYADLPATGLVNANSRVRYKLLMAGTPDVIAGLEKSLDKKLPAGVEMRDMRDSRRELVDATDSAQRFLALAALVSVLVSAVAMILAARRYAIHYTDTAAVLKCLGLTRRRVQTLLLLELLWLGILAGVIGVLLGFLAQYGLVAALKGLLPADLPAASFIPALSAFAIGLVLLIGFALPPFMRLGDTPPARVLRRDLLQPPVRGYVIYGAAILATLILTWWQVRELRLALYVLLGLVITVAVLTLGAVLLLALMRPLRRGAGIGWRYGLANLNRHRRDAVIQMVAFGIGIMVLLLLGLVRGNLLSSWRTSLPADAPNQFIINIQPDQRSTVERFFTSHGLAAPTLHPIVRARLTAINGVDVSQIHFAEPHAQHLLNREANLSWSDTLPAANIITAGHWWNATEAQQPLASLEEDFAKQLKLKVGDKLTFDIGGTPTVVSIASLRKVRWDSFQPNFFVELSPGALSGYPATWITSVYLPPQKAVILADLVRQLPSLTIFDVDAILEQVRHLMDQASLAVEYVFLFTLGAGIVVLLAAVQATRDERRFEAAVLRALGASRRLLRSAAATEYAALGFVAGLLGALTASMVAWLLASRVFSLSYHPDWRVWAIGIIAGTLIVGLSGLLANRHILNASPVETLRET
ncbi:MAG TPA: FtsX-like permease family protein [Gammaproteobacteria bacterium]|nr:FtsX-like permease family protein [Gammaproteobacteria bacterium]